MSVGMPTRLGYGTDPFTIGVSTTKTAIPLTEWPIAKGDSAYLIVQVPADGQSVAVCGSASSAAVGAFPDYTACKAKRDDTAGINFVMQLGPIARSDVADLRLIASGTFDAVCWWLPVTEPGA